MKFQYNWLALPDSQFELEMQKWFREMSSFRYRTATREEHVQTAVNITAAYVDAVANHRWMGSQKYLKMAGQHTNSFRSSLPEPSAFVSHCTEEFQIFHAKQALLEEKLQLLAYWEDEFASEAWIQGDPESVGGTLHQLLDDAEAAMNDPGRQSWMTFWAGAKADHSVEWSSERLFRAVSGKASFEAGAKLSGEFTWEWKGIVKLEASHEEFVGVRGSASGSASIGLSGSAISDRSFGLAAEFEAGVEMGVRLTGALDVSVGDVLSAGGSYDAFAGAMASTSAVLYLSTDKGIGVSLSAEAFAGAKIEGEGHAQLMWKGREIFKTTAKGSLNAGVGANFKCEAMIPRVGASTFALEMGATLGVGADAGTAVEFSMTNLRLAGEQFLYEEIRQAFVKEEFRYQRMMGDVENRILLGQVKAAVQQKLNTLETHRLNYFKADEIRRG